MYRVSQKDLGCYQGLHEVKGEEGEDVQGESKIKWNLSENMAQDIKGDNAGYIRV